MGIIVQSFWLPRKGSSPSEYEDAWATNPESGRFAVADGASEGCFTGLWARLLVADFVGRAGEGMEPWPASLSAIQGQWDADVRGRKLPWHAALGVERGACAAFLGVVFAPFQDVGHRWQAVAVGDTCLFHTRGAALLGAFPLADSHQFNNAPKLVGARMSTEEVLYRCREWPDGRGESGDRLWLMTDALAQWCLASQEDGQGPWREMELVLAGPSGGERFSEWIDGLRSTRRLRNDDVTLLAILLEE